VEDIILYLSYINILSLSFVEMLPAQRAVDGFAQLLYTGDVYHISTNNIHILLDILSNIPLKCQNQNHDF